jgi:hypothetical protein
MKKVFKKSYLIENGGCYDTNKMRVLTAPRPNDDDDIFVHEILDQPLVPLYDKYYIIFKLCEISPQDVLDRMIIVLDAAYQYYKENYKDYDLYGEVVDIMHKILHDYLIDKLSYEELKDHQATIEAIGVESTADHRFATLGVYHFMDMVDAIEKDESFSNILEEAFYATKNFIRLLVSRPDLKEKLLKDLKEFTA